MSDEDLSKKLETYQGIAKENPSVNVNMLMMNALEQENQKLKTSKSHKWAYMVSIGLPPFGLLFALKYYLSGDKEEQTAGNICVALTAVAVLMFYIFSKALFSGSGASIEQIQKITPQDVMQLTK
ncbi:MAG: hypothetical protein HYZ51_01310 [Candidatus Doudnabacteria bacterium]|nr:hypothetical protein [Candidatus Doudnabacteria bacterium]